MTTNRDESLDLGRASRRSENEVLSSGTRGRRIVEDLVYEPEPDVTENVYEGEESSNHVREVNIKPLDSGYLVKVGCQSVAVETTETLVKALSDYLNNPDSFERAWFKNKNRSKL